MCGSNERSSTKINSSDCKNHPAVVSIFVASANEMEVIVGETELGKAVLGVVDGTSVNKIETEVQKMERRALAEKFGYKIE